VHTLTPILAEIGIVDWLAYLFMGATRLLLIYFLLSIIPVAIGWWKVFTKAGQPGWAVLIPIYNLIVLLRVAGLAKVGVLPILIPFICVFVFPFWITWVHYHISRRFGHGIGFTIGLTLCAPIFWLILGFGSSKYIGEQPAQA